MRSSMPSRSPRSATITRGAGHSRTIAANTAQPGSTKSTRSGPDAGMRLQPLPAQRPQIGQRRVGRLGGQHRAVHQRPAIARQPQRHAGQGGDRAAGAEQLHAAVADLAGDAVHRLEGRQPGGDIVDHRLEPVGVEAGLAEPLRQRHHADRQRVIADQLRPPVRVDAHPGELGRAAADVEQQRPPPASRPAAARSFPAPARPPRATEMTPMSSPVSLLHPGEELGRRWRRAGRPRWRSRAAARTGRRASRAAQACSAASARSIAAGLSWPVRCSPSPSRTMRLKLSSTRNPSPRGRRHQHAAVVGAEVERGEGRRRRTAAVRRDARQASARDWTFRGSITALSSAPASPGKRS